MDEIALYFEAKSRSAVHPRRAASVHVRASGSINSRMTVCCFVAADGTKLPLFVIFKGTPGIRSAHNQSKKFLLRVFFSSFKNCFSSDVCSEPP